MVFQMRAEISMLCKINPTVHAAEDLSDLWSRGKCDLGIKPYNGCMIMEILYIRNLVLIGDPTLAFQPHMGEISKSSP